MNPRGNLGKVLVISGAMTIGVCLILTAVVGEPLILIGVLVGLFDVVLGLVFSGGMLSGRADRGDADENPYARED